MKRSAFSLIELLVVIIIIGALLAAAMPTYSRVVSIARRAVCASNLRSLRVLLQSAQQGERERRAGHSAEHAFVNMYKWPGTVAVVSNVPLADTDSVFICPEAIDVFSGVQHPPLQYRSALSPNPLLPFDPSHFNCVMRRGVTDDGEDYTEYCIEDNMPVEAKWRYAMGVWAYSQNDGVWCVFDKAEGGRRKVVLYGYTCDWPNQIYVDGEHYADLNPSANGMTIYFDSGWTSYAYNADLDGRTVVGEDTIVLLDYPGAYVDATDSQIYSDLNSEDSRRHLGKANVLYASGRVETVGTASLYPTIDMGQWTADPMD